MATTYHSYDDLVTQGRVNNRTTLYRWIKEGRFPKPVRLGPNTVAWTDEQLREFDARIAATEPTKAA
jgi:hypothetical protein